MTQSKLLNVSRRRLTAAGSLATIVSPFVWISNAAGAEQVVVRTPGGAFDTVKNETIYEPFRKATGIQVVPVAGTSGKLLAMMQSGQNELDLIDSGDDLALELGAKGYLMPIDYDAFKYTNPADLNPVVKRKFHVGSFVYALAMGYNTKAITPGTEPKSWAEFWDIKKYPQRRTLPDIASSSVALEFALLADGVPMDKLYPIDIDRALKSMSRIRSVIPKFWDTGALSSTMIVDNEVSMGAIWSTRASVAADEGAPIALQWNQNALLVQAYGIPKGSKNVENAKKFIDFSLSIESQSRWLGKYKAIPVNTKAYGATAKSLIDPATNVPWTESKGFLYDIQWWADNRKKVSDLWSKWLIS